MARERIRDIIKKDPKDDIIKELTQRIEELEKKMEGLETKRGGK